MKRAKDSLKLEVRHFGSASILWLVASILVCQYWESPSDLRSAQLGCVTLWVVSVLDFFILRMLIHAVVQKVSATSNGKSSFPGKILFWGFFKTVCLGLFIIVLLKGQKIPLLGLLMGVGTLAAVPLVGGFFWCWRELRRESEDA